MRPSTGKSALRIKRPGRFDRASLFALSFSLLFSGLACATLFKKSDAKKAEEEAEEKKRNDEDEDLLPHPMRADAWATNRMVMGNELPDRTKLVGCRADIVAMGKRALNADMLVESIGSLEQQVSEDTEFFHWCFYHSMVSLDWALENETRNLMLEERLIFFQQNMRGMWILARALDRTEDTKEYFKYLRKRYRQISQDYFGRTLDVLTPPLDVEYRIPEDKLDKPAGKNPPEEAVEE